MVKKLAQSILRVTVKFLITQWEVDQGEKGEKGKLVLAEQTAVPFNDFSPPKLMRINCEMTIS